MSPSFRRVANLAAIALALAGTWLIVVSVQNNPLEGWGMLLRALAGHALWIGAVECAARAKDGRSSPDARHLAAMILSLVLTPCAAIVVLMSKESGPSWSLSAMILFAWFAGTGIAAFVARHRSRRR